MRFPNGDEIRRKLNHEEWVELYLGMVTHDFYEVGPSNDDVPPLLTPGVIEKQLEYMGCNCREEL
jgi:hypothetical protein